jgi:phosphatidyl-myo-inositol dimannoside synthase
MTRRLVTIAHSYVVADNRRLAHEMALAGRGLWDVTAIAPRQYRGDLRRIPLESIPEEAADLRTTSVRLDRIPHLMCYRDLPSLLDHSWDVVHCWEEPYVLAGAQVARATPSGARLIVGTFQNIDKRYPWPFNSFERITMTRADGWFAFGETVRNALATRSGYADKPCRVLPPGVDVERFRADPDVRRRMLDRLGWSSDDLVVGFLGRFVPEKGIRVLLDALAAARVPWRALFVGGGPMERDIRETARVCPDRVRVVTSVAHDEVRAWLNAMTILCAPSQSTPRWREQFGRMLIEAMACGLPVVASDSGEIPFVVGQAAMLLPERDTRAWTHAIESLLEDAGARRSMSAAGRARAHDKFAWPVVARAHLGFAEELLDIEVAAS